ncbi:hypothetical protein [Streptomyces sp. NEAU-YJ-81]|uniref:hypothetical protein n=1 Tax=Streptomyces sp. NEAU-YJ-81 TaxID=2820288 RepID=UPI001FBA0AE8|nr:hypothetical protein [Streptomyces sp. NEAU-YJ-81]
MTRKSGGIGSQSMLTYASVVVFRYELVTNSDTSSSALSMMQSSRAALRMWRMLARTTPTARGSWGMNRP